MDSYSGSYPLKFVSFHLEMSNEERLPESTNPTIAPIGQGQEHEPAQFQNVPEKEVRPESQASNSTDESVSAYIEKVISQFPGASTTPLDTVLEEDPHAAPKVPEADENTHGAPKVSESIALEVTKTPQPVPANSEESRTRTPECRALHSDTSDPGELYDSSGVDLPTTKLGTFSFDPDLFTSLDEDLQQSSRNSDAELAVYRDKMLSTERNLSPTGREVIRKFFTKNVPVELPAGHSTVAFSESQVHAVLRTIADESVLSSFHMMKSLLTKLTEGIPLNKRTSRNIPRRSATPGPGYESSSGGESTGIESDGYTSGAMDTDEDMRNIETGSEGCPPIISASKTLDTAVDQHDPARVLTPCSGSSYSSGDYRPLASLSQAQAPVGADSSPPRKRRRMLCKPGKVMKDAYFKGIQWTRPFVSGPLDPLHNRYKFYCQICKTNISIYSKGARAILRHYKTQGHLRRDQRWRYEHLREIDATTGKVTHQVRGKDGYVLTPLQLEKEKSFFIDAPLVDIGDKFPFYDDYVATMGGTSSPDELRMTTQISLIGLFAPHGGDLALLRNLWTRFGAFTSHQGFFSDFDWRSDNLTVSITLTP